MIRHEALPISVWTSFATAAPEDPEVLPKGFSANVTKI